CRRSGDQPRQCGLLLTLPVEKEDSMTFVLAKTLVMLLKRENDVQSRRAPRRLASLWKTISVLYFPILILVDHRKGHMMLALGPPLQNEIQHLGAILAICSPPRSIPCIALSSMKFPQASSTYIGCKL